MKDVKIRWRETADLCDGVEPHTARLFSCYHHGDHYRAATGPSPYRVACGYVEELVRCGVLSTLNEGHPVAVAIVDQQTKRTSEWKVKFRVMFDVDAEEVKS